MKRAILCGYVRPPIDETTSLVLATFVALIDMHHSFVVGFSARPHHNTSFQKKYYAPFSSSASWTSSCSQHCRRTTILALEENSDDGGSRNNITPLCDLQTFLRYVVHICLSHACFVTTYQIKMDTFLCAWN